MYIYTLYRILYYTRNVLDCNQSNYSSRIIFSCTFTLEPNMKSIRRPVPEIWPFEILQNARSVGRRVGRSVLNITLFSYIPLRYVRNVAREE